MPYRTTPKMAERKDARRQKFLEAATRLFGEHGYHATTVPMIVAESGSSTGSFYFYFRNKEDIFAATLEALGERIAAALNEAIAARSGLFPQMRAAMERLILFLAENPRQSRILIVESSGLGERLERIRRELIAQHARGVEQALAHVAGINASVAARCAVGAVYESVYHWLDLPESERMPPHELARQVADFNLRAFGAIV